MISTGDTFGVFQLEGSGFRRLVQEMRPNSFADLTALVALYRPGPMENIPAYLARKQGREPIQYLHERLAPILQETYGVMIYQEQVMMAARELAGFSLGQADVLRSAMGKKDKVKMAQAARQVHRRLRRRRHRPRQGGGAVRRHRPLRPVRLQQGALGGLRDGLLRDRVSEGQLPPRVHDVAAHPPAGQLQTGWRPRSSTARAAISRCSRPRSTSRGPTSRSAQQDKIRFGLAAIKNVGRERGRPHRDRAGARTDPSGRSTTCASGSPASPTSTRGSSTR